VCGASVRPIEEAAAGRLFAFEVQLPRGAGKSGGEGIALAAKNASEMSEWMTALEVAVLGGPNKSVATTAAQGTHMKLL
jgi:hypothetical protein